MQFNANDAIQYAFYVVLLLIAGASEYLHITPSGTMVAVLGLVTGHFFGNVPLKNTINQVLSGVTTLVTEKAVEPTPKA